ncbi:MAG: homoserine kinase [Bacteriovoracaceae bacterium]|nr:homoserine kinase [Bacteriovoracaceae bacterium]
MAVKTNLCKDDLIQILSKYNLGKFRRSKLFDEGTVQTNILLKTTNGRFVLRYYENRSKDSVLFESNLIKYLKDKNYPCPTTYKNKNGDFVGVYNQKPYMIFEFIEGIHLKNPNRTQKNQLIQKVAQLQNITKNYKPANNNYRWNYDIKLCRALAKKEADKINSGNSRKKLKWHTRELAKLKLPITLPKGICHCDFHFSNVLFKDGKFNALIDFDDANYTFLMFDLVCLINPFIPSFLWNNWSTHTANDNVLDFREAKKTVSEYMKHRILNSNEKRHIFDLYKLGVLFDCVWYFERGDVKDFYEKRKIDHLNKLGREEFYNKIF